MKIKFNLNTLFNNDKFLLVFSLVAALIIWLVVIVYESPETNRVIRNVKVHIDTTVPQQFGLEVFGENDFVVDVTVKGKKYQISSAALSPEDIVVTAQTNNVDSAGRRTLQLKAEAPEGADYIITSISTKTVDVYFDTEKTVEMVIEPQIVTDGFSIVDEGFTSGDFNLSSASITLSGPSTEINRIEKVVAKLVLDEPLSSNKSADAEIIILNDKGKSDFKFISKSLETVTLTIPVLQEKELNTIVTFKNAPDNFVVTPLKYTITPAKAKFNISVDDYDQTVDYSVGTIDFKNLSLSNHVFTFYAENTAVSKESTAESFTVDVKLTGIKQEYMTYPEEKININNPGNKNYRISGLNKSVLIVGSEKELEKVVEENIKVDVDLSEVKINKGQTVTVPAIVSVDNPGCWICGTYYVEVSL